MDHADDYAYTSDTQGEKKTTDIMHGVQETETKGAEVPLLLRFFFLSFPFSFAVTLIGRGKLGIGKCKLTNVCNGSVTSEKMDLVRTA